MTEKIKDTIYLIIALIVLAVFCKLCLEFGF